MMVAPRQIILMMNALPDGEVVSNWATGDFGASIVEHWEHAEPMTLRFCQVRLW